MTKSRRIRPFPVVAIGASAGGLKAFEDLLAALPKKPGMAFVLVPHLAPQHKSHLTEILARFTALPLREVKNGDRVLANHIFVLPPNRDMRIRDGVLRLSTVGPKAPRRNPIDGFFRSLAVDQGARAVGVLLSGAGSDGTAGLQAIKDGGGTTFAQDRETAAHISMPHSAAMAGCVDHILSPAAIGRKLGSSGGVGALRRDARRSEGDVFPDRILAYLGSMKGIEFELYKRNTLKRRIQRRMVIRRIENPESYLAMLRADPEELDLLYRAVLISVTSFFREPESFRALKSTIYPRLFKNRSSRTPIRIWVPGCSTGEEVYSHAINLVEYLGSKAPRTPFQIFATDANPLVIESARAGLYSKKILSAISPERLKRFFIETADGYRISPAIRERCIFATKNLVQDPPFINLDLISCRNLLIYFGPSLQERALQVFQYALRPRGILMLGRSETAVDFLGRFTLLSVKRKVFSERTLASKARIDFVQPGRFLETPPAFLGAGQTHELMKSIPEHADMQAELDSVLPARYLPNGVIVSGDLEILRFVGDTSPFLRPAPGKPSLNLRGMAPKEFVLNLRAAVHVARKSGGAVVKNIPAPRRDGTAGRTRIEVLPVKASKQLEGCFLILFETPAIAADPMPGRGTRNRKDSRRVTQLKEDLAVSAEHLKVIIDEQEVTNARLKTSNEELLSSNEELQSVNEEFETAKEELQSTNEELVTSTEEVARGNEVLLQANSDLNNLLANIDIPIVLLTPDLAVHRYTPPAEKTLGLSASSIGKRIEDAGLPLRLPDLKQRLLNVVKNRRVQELEVQDSRGREYYLFLRPYSANKQGVGKTPGAVMALVDIHDRKLSEKALLRLATLIRDSNDAVITRDRKGRITAWNRGARKMYGYTEAEAMAMDGKGSSPGAAHIRPQDLLRMAAQGGGAPTEITRRAKNGRILDVLVTVTVLRDDKGRPVEFLTTERDITGLKLAGRELRRLHARVISSKENERKRLARELHDGVGQILTGVKFRLEAVPETPDFSGPRAAAEILKLSELLSLAISEIRRVSQNLMPSELEDLGLASALRTLCRKFKSPEGARVTLKTRAVPQVIAPDLALAFFRIAQETLNNAGKHAQARTITLSLSRKGGDLVLRVRDDGIGFTPGRDNRRRRKGIGLSNIQERSHFVGGTLDIVSKPGTGTTVSVRAPLARPKEDSL